MEIEKGPARIREEQDGFTVLFMGGTYKGVNKPEQQPDINFNDSGYHDVLIDGSIDNQQLCITNIQTC